MFLKLQKDDDNRSRLSESIDTALGLSEGLIQIEVLDEKSKVLLFSSNFCVGTVPQNRRTKIVLVAAVQVFGCKQKGRSQWVWGNLNHARHPDVLLRMACSPGVAQNSGSDKI